MKSSSKKIIPILKITIASYTASFGVRDRENAEHKGPAFSETLFNEATFVSYWSTFHTRILLDDKQ